MVNPAANEAEIVRDLAAAYRQMTEQIGKVIVGQNEVVEQLLMALFSRGHCLLVGVPGLAKTLLVSTVSKILHLSFKRIQFTPDLMPADITGTDILQDDPETGRRKFVFLPGPIFANMVLADEINRTPPKTQAALLEAMQEHHVTAGSQTYHLPEPFFVLATQNPIEQEGTYPLPEAQLDRFMFNIKVGYPSRAEEMEIMKRTTSTQHVDLQASLDGEQIQRLQEVVRQVVVADHVFEYVADLVRATRPREIGVPKFVPELLTWGAGPRACQYLILGGKARAIFHGRLHVSTDDIRAVAYPVLRHRLVTTFNADAEGVTTDEIIKRLIETVPLPQEQAAAKVKRAEREMVEDQLMAYDAPDPVELVMNIEQAFHITIPDSDAEKIYSVGELYAYVLAKLPQPPSQGCISSATFYRLRRILQELFAIPRERIRPAARIEDLISPEGRPERWARLVDALRPAWLPELLRPRWMQPWLPPCGLLALFTMMLTVGCILLAVELHWPGGVVFALAFLGTLLCIFVDVVVNRAIYRRTARYALDIPPGCVTIRGIVYTVLQSEPGRIVSETARASDAEIWSVLCSIVGRCLEVPPETLTPDRRFC